MSPRKSQKTLKNTENPKMLFWANQKETSRHFLKSHVQDTTTTTLFFGDLKL